MIEVGMQVLRKGSSLRWGIVRQIRPLWGALERGETTPTHAEVDWHAPRRIGGNGWHRSTIRLSSLVIKTEEEVAQRRTVQEQERHEQEVLTRQRREQAARKYALYLISCNTDTQSLKVAVANGGTNDLDNLQLLCETCNGTKSNRE